MSALPENRRGIASGTVATAKNIGMMVGVRQAGLIFNMVFMIKSGGQNFSVYHKSMEPYFMAAFRYAMLSGAFLACIGIFIAFMRGSDKKIIESGSKSSLHLPKEKHPVSDSSRYLTKLNFLHMKPD